MRGSEIQCRGNDDFNVGVCLTKVLTGGQADKRAGEVVFASLAITHCETLPAGKAGLRLTQQNPAGKGAFIPAHQNKV
jgi:hypothetical protein